ncbi:MAG: glcA 1 [Phycisphaerales bacterium]|nr:glcA 1 [Phycisphaerales bacterium]
MRSSGLLLALSAALAGLGVVAAIPSAAQAPAAAPAPAGWKLVWSDEFDGAQIDKAKWALERGSGITDPATNTFLAGWGNNELEFYTSRPENVYLKDGMLHIRAVKESYKGCGYTSARLSTKGLFAAKYGRFEFRAKLPTGKGIWPAIWMLPQDNKYGGWASSGEIDLMEARGQEPEKVLGTLHYGSRWPANAHTGKDYILPDKGTIADFHVYALEWDPGEIRWYVDDKLYQTQNFWWSCSDTDGPKGVNPEVEAEINPWPAPFDKPFYIILNVAVGGQFLGNPDSTTTFPAEMVVDYVRAYERAGGEEKLKPRGMGKLPFSK